MGLTTTSRLNFYRDDNFSVDIQDIGGQFHVHCEVTTWKPSVLKQMYKVAAKLISFAEHMGYKEIVSISPNRKFCELLGGTLIGEQEECEVMIWELKYFR